MALVGKTELDHVPSAPDYCDCPLSVSSLFSIIQDCKYDLHNGNKDVVIFKMNGYTSKGDHSDESIYLPCQKGLFLKERICSP